MAEAAARLASYGEADWRRAAEATLKGAGFATLISRGADGIELQPLYPRREGPRALHSGGGWRVLARLDHPDPAAANDQADRLSTIEPEAGNEQAQSSAIAAPSADGGTQKPKGWRFSFGSKRK